MPGLVVTSAVCIAGVAILCSTIDINHFAMRFFRDLSRSKARKRLYGNKHALIPMLLGIEEPVERTPDDESTETLTRAELASYNGADGSPLYISISGRVYDVSSGAKFYGEGGRYHSFVGTDATRAFATGCTRPECITSSVDGLTEKEFREIDRWIELYDKHDKYIFIGHLVDDPVDAVIANDSKAQTGD